MAKTAEQLLAEVIVEKFEFLLSPTWQQENKSLSRSYPSFFSPAPIQEPLLPKTTSPQNSTQKNQYLYYSTLIGFSLIGGFSGLLFYFTDKAAGEMIKEQVHGWANWLGENTWNWLGAITDGVAQGLRYLIPGGGVETNSILGMQISIMLVNTVYQLANRSDSEKALMGAINLIPWFAGTFVALGATLPLAILDTSKANDTTEEALAWMAALTALPASLFGGRYLLNYFFPNFFSNTIDDGRNSFTPDQVEVLTRFKKMLIAQLYDKMAIITLEYTTQKSCDLSGYVEKVSCLKLQLNRSGPDLVSSLQDCIQFFLKIPANQAAVKVRRHKLCQLFKNIGKTTVAVSIVVSAVALVLIDILIGFYAGYDPWDPLALKIVIGGLAGLLTGLACGGFSLYSLQGIFDRLRQEDNSNIVSQTHPVAYLALSIVLVIGGLLSGGSGAIAGRDELRRLLQDLGQNELAQWFPSVAETLGYGGAISVAIPYCMDWVQWSLHTYAEKKGDFALQQCLHLLKGFNALVDVIGCMKLNYMSALAKANIWGNSELLAEVGLVDSLGAVP